jgi:Flp pilus assembly protein TadD
LLRRGNHVSGIETARQATLLQPDNAAAWNNLAVGHSNRRQWDAAIAAATRAVELAPSFQLAKNNLAWAVRHKRGVSQPDGSAAQRPSG